MTRKKLNILVVDDQEFVRHYASDVLELAGYLVETAQDGLEGLKKFAQGQYDLVLTDKTMPRLNGRQLALSIKASSPQTPVIMMTGEAANMSGPPAGVDVLLAKPFNQAELLTAIKAVMKN